VPENEPADDGTRLSLAGLENLGDHDEPSKVDSPLKHEHRRNHHGSDFSLQTTSSQESIEVSELLMVTKSGDAAEDVDVQEPHPNDTTTVPQPAAAVAALSLRLSQVDMDDLPSNTSSNSPNNETSDANTNKPEITEPIAMTTKAQAASRLDRKNTMIRADDEKDIKTPTRKIGFVASFAAWVCIGIFLSVLGLWIILLVQEPGTSPERIMAATHQPLLQFGATLEVVEDLRREAEQLEYEANTFESMLTLMGNAMATMDQQQRESSTLSLTMYNAIVENVLPTMKVHEEVDLIPYNDTLFMVETERVPEQIRSSYFDNTPEPTPISHGEVYSFVILPLLAMALLMAKSKLSSANQSKAHAKEVCVKTESLDDDCYHNGVPPSIEPTEYMNSCYGQDGLDLSMYESLKASDLRGLLQERKLSTAGRKPALIRRLVMSKQSELATLTVQQIRPKLRGRGLGQGGQKVDLIRRLVEYGPN
jgi:hypothetical protein